MRAYTYRVLVTLIVFALSVAVIGLIVGPKPPDNKTKCVAAGGVFVPVDYAGLCLRPEALMAPRSTASLAASHMDARTQAGASDSQPQGATE